MVYIVKTQYRAGIFLSRAAIDQNMKRGKPWIRKFEVYEEAIQALKEDTNMADFPIPWENFRPNRMYKIRDDAVYSVIFTKYKAGFVKTEGISDFLERYRIEGHRCKSRLMYQRALQMVWELGVITGGDELFAKRNPRCGRYYKREVRQ